jgi:hypothetical protein
MTPMHLSTSAASTAAKALVKATLLFGSFMALVSGLTLGDPMEKRGITPYVTHFIFRPVESIDTAVGTTTLLEAVGTT